MELTHKQIATLIEVLERIAVALERLQDCVIGYDAANGSSHDVIRIVDLTGK